MSTRWYPLYQRGNPQLRVFLPNFWLKVIKPTNNQPSNVVQFIVSLEMTKYDVKNYLENIYKIPVVEVRTRIETGKTKRDQMKGYITKGDDLKLAYVTLPKDQSFEFPNIFVEDEKKILDDRHAMEEAKKGHTKYEDRNKSRPGVPGWFSI